jgi:hypothetical protein
MAGVKVTDLPVLGAADSDDVLYIVDTSSNTSSQIEVSSLLPVIPVLDSGTWIPSFTGFAGCVVSATYTRAFYSRVGNIVTATIYSQVDLDFSISSGTGYLEYSIPIATTSFEPIGLGQLFQEATNCNIGSDSVKMYFYSTSSSNIGSTNFTFTFQYEIN